VVGSEVVKSDGLAEGSAGLHVLTVDKQSLTLLLDAAGKTKNASRWLSGCHFVLDRRRVK
jgi:hypothetical protein